MPKLPTALPDFPATATLVVIDMQRGFDDPCWGPRNNPETEASVARLLAAWPAAGRPAALVHAVALGDLHGEFATVVRTDDLLAAGVGA